jgi:Tfp pilus assembly protein PilO
MRYRSPLLATLASVLLAVGWWFLLYQPNAEERDELAAETAQLETREALLQTEIAELERVRDNELAIRSELSLMEEYIPNNVAQPMALRDLQDAADAAGVVIDTLAFGTPVAVDDAPPTGQSDTTLASVGVSMTVHGGYFQLVDLLRRLEVDVPRAILIDSVAMSEGGQEGFPTLSTNWSGRVFAVVDVASTVSPEEGAPPDPDADVDTDADDESDDGDEDGATT